MALGMGTVFVTATAAANDGVPPANGFDLALAARRLPLLEQAGAKLATRYGVKYRTEVTRTGWVQCRPTADACSGRS